MVRLVYDCAILASSLKFLYMDFQRNFWLEKNVPIVQKLKVNDSVCFLFYHCGNHCPRCEEPVRRNRAGWPLGVPGDWAFGHVCSPSRSVHHVFATWKFWRLTGPGNTLTFLSLYYPSFQPSSEDDLMLTPHPFPVRTALIINLLHAVSFGLGHRELERCCWICCTEN